jgi:hypothetical protein
MQQLHVDKPGLRYTKRSRSLDSASRQERSLLAAIAIFALVCLSLDTLGSALVWIESAAFQRYCHVVDASAVAATIQLVVGFGPTVWLLLEDICGPGSDLGAPTWRAGGVRVLDALALLHIAGYVIILRLPWLTGQASAYNRLDLWSARLSSTIDGIPVVAFLMAVGFGVRFVAMASATLRALCVAGFLQNPRLLGRFAVAVWLICAVDFAVAMVTLVTFATGGLS